jgi:hypothetical protein
LYLTVPCAFSPFSRTSNAILYLLAACRNTMVFLPVASAWAAAKSGDCRRFQTRRRKTRSDKGKKRKVLVVPPPPLYKLRPCPSYSRRRDSNNCVRNLNYVQDAVRPHKAWVCRHVCQLHGAMDTFVVSLCPLQPIWLKIWEYLCFIFPFLASAHHAIFSF